jgi:hypothetical protein
LCFLTWHHALTAGLGAFLLQQRHESRPFPRPFVRSQSVVIIPLLRLAMPLDTSVKISAYSVFARTAMSWRAAVHASTSRVDRDHERYDAGPNLPPCIGHAFRIDNYACLYMPNTDGYLERFRSHVHCFKTAALAQGLVDSTVTTVLKQLLLQYSFSNSKMVQIQSSSSFRRNLQRRTNGACFAQARAPCFGALASPTPTTADALPRSGVVAQAISVPRGQGVPGRSPPDESADRRWRHRWTCSCCGFVEERC